MRISALLISVVLATSWGQSPAKSHVYSAERSPYGPASSGHQRPDVPAWGNHPTPPRSNPSGRQEVSQGRGFRWMTEVSSES